MLTRNQIAPRSAELAELVFIVSASTQICLGPWVARLKERTQPCHPVDSVIQLGGRT